MLHRVATSVWLWAIASMASLLVSGPLMAQTFVNWETPQVHPVDLTSNSRLLVVNTADNRLEIFDVSGALPPPQIGSVPVGLDPVTVRVLSDTEAWVVNQISDSISIVNLTTGNVQATLLTRDEPADVVFAGSPTMAFVSCSQANVVQIFDPNDLSAPPLEVPIDGEDPRAMAVNATGTEVYVGIFESGNGSTILGGGTPDGPPPQVVSDTTLATPYGGVNPPPNLGTEFLPPIRPEYLRAASNENPAPRVSLIVKQDSTGAWMDDNLGNWTEWVSGASAAASGRPVGWTLLDNDIAIINTADRSVTYATRLMNSVMALAVNPTSGDIMAVGTDALNQIRYEPNLVGTFLRVGLARVAPQSPGAGAILDLNNHLDYSQGTLPQAVRDCAVGDPRAIVWLDDGSRGYVAGMGSSNVVAIDSQGNRATVCRNAATDTIAVGPGPTGLALQESQDRLYVLNRFEATVSVVNLDTEQEIGRFSFFDPTTDDIRIGRQHLYDTHATSGLGHISCGSCHIDGRMDRLAWDLGDPSGEMKDLTDVLDGGQHNLEMNTPEGVFAGDLEDFHPMKGPMLTQTFQDIVGKEPLHWRGDRDGFEEFSGAFVSLNGDDEEPDNETMQEFEAFVATIRFPPNPFRNRDNTLPTNLPLPGHVAAGTHDLEVGAPLPNGNAASGRDLYVGGVQGANSACTRCHTLPTGTSADLTLVGDQFEVLDPGLPNGERHLFLLGPERTPETTVKPAQLRNLYERVGFDTIQSVSRAGFGFTHDGSVDSLSQFLARVINTNSDQEVADLLAFMLAFSGSGPELPVGSLDPADNHPLGPPSLDTHAGVGLQQTVNAANLNDQAVIDRLAFLQGLSDSEDTGLVVKGKRAGDQRGWVHTGDGALQSDRQSETTSILALRQSVIAGAEVTFTVVPLGTEVRIGVDRDLDGCFDRDEIDLGFDPADDTSTPPPADC
ncbi:MAG: hypothetical protein K0U98_13850 [Deltaproteobacteria bacterium]|nr:hypothetical protein [Deltaproteobacteria bacterium]